MDDRTLASLSDEELVIQFQQTRAQTYFEELWRRYWKSIHLRCYSLVHDPAIAEDLTTESFLKALKGIDDYQTGRFEGWLLTIARTTCLNHLQKAYVRREQSKSDEEWLVMDNAKSNPTPEDFAFAAQIRKFIDQLPEKQRVAVKLYYLEGYSYDQIATETGETPNAVKSQLQNAIRKLRILCEAQGAGK